MSAFFMRMDNSLCPQMVCIDALRMVQWRVDNFLITSLLGY